MDMTAAERITAIQESATLLSEQTGSDVDLILAQHGIETPDSWEETLYTYVIHTLKYEPNERLQALHRYLMANQMMSRPDHDLGARDNSSCS